MVGAHQKLCIKHLPCIGHCRFGSLRHVCVGVPIRYGCTYTYVCMKYVVPVQAAACGGKSGSPACRRAMFYLHQEGGLQISLVFSECVVSTSWLAASSIQQEGMRRMRLHLGWLLSAGSCIFSKSGACRLIRPGMPIILQYLFCILYLII